MQTHAEGRRKEAVIICDGKMYIICIHACNWRENENPAQQAANILMMAAKMHTLRAYFSNDCDFIIFYLSTVS